MMKLSADDVELDMRERYLVAQALFIAAAVLAERAPSNAEQMETLLNRWFTQNEMKIFTAGQNFVPRRKSDHE